MSVSTELPPTAAPADASALQAVKKIVQQALHHHQSGRLEIAESLYRTVLEVQPQHAEANYQLGRLAVQVDQAQAALPHFAVALTARPEIDRYWLGYVDAMVLADEMDAARQLLALWRQQGDLAQAMDTLQQTHAVPESSVPVPGDARPDSRQPIAATKGLEKAQPSPRETKKLAQLYKQGKLPETKALADSLTVRFPAYWFGWLVLGVVLMKKGEFAQALAPMQTAVQLSPEDAEGHLNLGLLLKALERTAEAEASYRRALELEPAYVLGHQKLGELLSEEERFAEAEASLRRALAIDPVFMPAHRTLILMLHAQGRLGEAEASYRQVLQLQPDNAGIYSSLLFLLLLKQDMDPASLFAEHRRFGKRFEAPLRGLWRKHANPREPQRVLQIGVVSGDLRRHSVFSFFEPLVALLAGYSGLVLHAYNNWADEDDCTQLLRGHFRHWNRVADLSDTALAEKIRADGIDILIDLSGHTGANRLLTFAHKPAPLQVSWLGYPGTTGLRSMDYYLCDPFLLPPGRFDDQFTEKLVYLPANAPFTQLVHLASVNELPALRNGYVTFGSFNRPDKITRSVIGLWSKLLLALPTSRMVLGAMPNEECDFLIGCFAEEGIARERLSFYPRAGMTDYLTLHHQVDLCLDTFPYNGGTTTLHALSMGVPTLTLAGHILAGRVGAGILGQVGLDQFVVEDEAEFVERGLSCAGDLPMLASVRAGLRERFAQSALGQPAVIAASLERALRMMWARWCAGKPAQSFIVDRPDIDQAAHDSSKAQP